ncbi:MAG: YdeI/OmpD-associated family protein [Puia sp.]|nr:YdeI/OmpD-associated family protein [Puia sp.]
MKIREYDILLTLNAPDGFKRSLGTLPTGVKIVSAGREYQQIHWFVLNKSLLNNELPKILRLLREDVLCWVYYPKRSSKIQTDLSRDKGWEELLRQNIRWLSLISFDDTWSAFSLRLKTACDDKKMARPKERPVFEYVDPVKKTVRLPEDFEKVLAKDKKAEAFFQALSFTNKKEYVEWVVSAKREATRTERVNESLDRLRREWKNPRNL